MKSFKFLVSQVVLQRAVTYGLDSVHPPSLRYNGKYMRVLKDFYLSNTTSDVPTFHMVSLRSNPRKSEDGVWYPNGEFSKQ